MPPQKPAVQVVRGCAEISNGYHLYSDGFVDCNLIILKKTNSREVFMGHQWFATEPARTPAGKSPYPRGIGEQFAAQLEQFLKGTKPGEVVGISIYRPHNLDAEPVGSQNDFQTTEYLKSRGINMRRHALPRFVDTYPNARTAKDGDLAGFNAFWDYFEGELTITQSSPALSTNPHSPRAQTYSTDPAEHQQWISENKVQLLKIKPFKDLSVYGEKAR